MCEISVDISFRKADVARFPHLASAVASCPLPTLHPCQAFFFMQMFVRLTAGSSHYVLLYIMLPNRLPSYLPTFSWLQPDFQVLRPGTQLSPQMFQIQAFASFLSQISLRPDSMNIWLLTWSPIGRTTYLHVCSPCTPEWAFSMHSQPSPP